jgi:phospholipase/lecithinase/hemolysin
MTEPRLARVWRDAICASPREYLFWDAIHPTASGHRILAAAALDTLQP